MTPEPWHGTDGGYNNHACRCTPCRAAHNAYRKTLIAAARQRAAADPALITHGVMSGYGYWGCRCGACVQANRDRVTAARAPAP